MLELRVDEWVTGETGLELVWLALVVWLVVWDVLRLVEWLLVVLCFVLLLVLGLWVELDDVEWVDE